MNDPHRKDALTKRREGADRRRSPSSSPPPGAASCSCQSHSTQPGLGRQATAPHCGSVNGTGIRAVIEPTGDNFGFTLGPISPAGSGVAIGDEVAVEIAPEGPQRGDLAEDVAAALAANPEAGAFF